MGVFWYCVTLYYVYGAIKVKLVPNDDLKKKMIAAGKAAK